MCSSCQTSADWYAYRQVPEGVYGVAGDDGHQGVGQHLGRFERPGPAEDGLEQLGRQRAEEEGREKQDEQEVLHHVGAEEIAFRKVMEGGDFGDQEDDEHQGQVDPLAPGGLNAPGTERPRRGEVQPGQDQQSGQHVRVQPESARRGRRNVEIGTAQPEDDRFSQRHGSRASLPSCLT